MNPKYCIFSSFPSLFFFNFDFGDFVVAVAVWPCLDWSLTGRFYGLKIIDPMMNFFYLGLSFEVTVGLTFGSICLGASLDVLAFCLRTHGQRKKRMTEKKPDGIEWNFLTPKPFFFSLSIFCEHFFNGCRRVCEKLWAWVNFCPTSRITSVPS